MSDDLQQQIADMQRQLNDLAATLARQGIQLDDLSISVRTSRMRFSERMATTVTAIVGVIMAIFTIMYGMSLFYG